MSELYQLPDGWGWKKLDEFVEIKGGKRLPNGKKLVEYKTPYPYIRVSDFNEFGSINLNSLQYITEGIYSEIKNYIISKHDIYISIAGTIGKTGIIPDELDGANLTENAARLIFDNNNFDKLYLLLFTKSRHFLEQVGLATKVVAMPKLALTRLKNVHVPLPPLAEQKRVVQKLDALFERIDKAITLLQKNIAAADNFMNSVLNDVFSDLEQNYPLLELDKTVDFGGKNIVAINNPDLIYLSLEDIQANTGKIINYRTVSESGVIGTSVLFDNNCVLYSKLRPYLNKVTVPEVNGCATTELVVIKPHNSLYKYFVSYFLRNPTVVNFLNNDSMGAKMPRTNMKTFKRLNIPVPEYSKQLEVVKYLDNITAQIEQVKSAQQQKMQNLLDLKSSILDQAFHGKL